MPVYIIDGKKPKIGTGTWIAPSAEIIGDVTIGRDCYIGFGAVIRGDFGKITIGDQSLVEEATVIHCAKRTVIGSRVIIGHMVMMHDATVKDNALVGMQSMLCDYSLIQEYAIIAEQSLVMKRQVIPSRKIFGGAPAAEIGDVTDRHVLGLTTGIKEYGQLREKYLASFKAVQ